MIKELYTPQQIDLWERARELAETAMRPVAAKYDVEQAYPWEVQQGIRPNVRHIRRSFLSASITAWRSCVPAFLTPSAHNMVPR